MRDWTRWTTPVDHLLLRPPALTLPLTLVVILVVPLLLLTSCSAGPPVVGFDANSGENSAENEAEEEVEGEEGLCVPQCSCFGTFFSCGGQGFNRLPSSLPAWLTTLDLNSNVIERLESGSPLANLPSLTHLHLAKNRIRLIDRDALSQLKNLEELDLSRNKLEGMESLRFQQLKKLHLLNLRRNPISNLSDAAFYGLDNLQHLQLEWCSIGTLERRWLYGLRSLKTLNLSHNQITSIEPDACEFLHQLQHMDLSVNQIEDLSARAFTGLVALTTLDLRQNQIVAVDPSSFTPLKKLHSLDLSENALSWALEDLASPFRTLSHLTSLNLATNQIHSVHAEALEGLDALRVLNLTSNPLVWLSHQAFLRVPSSTTLQLDNVTTFLCDCHASWLQLRLQQLISGHSGLHSSNPSSSRPGRKKKPEVEKSTVPVAAVGGEGPLLKGPLCAFPLSLQNKTLLDISPELLTCPENSPKPVFLTEPESQVFLVDGNGSLECSVESFTPSVVIRWNKGHEELPEHLEDGVETKVETRSMGGGVGGGGGASEGGMEGFLSSSALHFVNVSWEDVGCYQCVAHTPDLGLVYSAKANITVHVLPSWVKRPSNVTVRVGSNAKLECGAKGLPSPEIAFQKDGGEDFPAALERRFHVMPNDDSFFIVDVKLSDSGVYSCSATNSAGTLTANATLTVFETPRLVEPMEDESAVEGSNAILECSGSGSPQPLPTWTKDGLKISSSAVSGGGVGGVGGVERRIHLRENGSLLVIKNVEVGDGGRYECFLTNAVGTARGVSTLTVLARGAGVKLVDLDNTTMTIIFIIIAVFCVVVTSAAWVVVIYRTRQRLRAPHAPTHHSALLHHSNFERTELTSFPLPYDQISKAMCGDEGGASDSSSCGKDSGTGDEVQGSTGGGSGSGRRGEVGVVTRGGGAGGVPENFSTFGHRTPTYRWTPAAEPVLLRPQQRSPRLEIHGDVEVELAAKGVVVLREGGGGVRARRKSKNIPLPMIPPQGGPEREELDKKWEELKKAEQLKKEEEPEKGEEPRKEEEPSKAEGGVVVAVVERQSRCDEVAKCDEDESMTIIPAPRRRRDSSVDQETMSTPV